MPSLTKGVNLFAGSRLNFVLAFGTVLVIAALIFFPTWSTFWSGSRNNFFDRDIENTVSLETGEEQDDFQHAVEEKPSPLALLAAQIEAGHFDYKPAPDAAAGGVPEEEIISWKAIRSGDSIKALRRANLETKRLVKQLDSFKLRSREALGNYAATVKLLLKGGEDKIDLANVRALARSLDDMVTQEFINEGADRADLLRWVKINLGPVLEPDWASSPKRSLEIPFKPNITLAHVKVWQEGRRYHGRGLNPNGNSRVTLRGYVYGKDLKYLELDTGGKTRKVFMKAKPDQMGRRFFKLVWLDSRPPFTLRARDQVSGKFVQKTYQFHPRALRFPWDKGFFQIPFREMDPRIDGYFLASSGGSGEDDSGQGDLAVF